KGWFVFDQAGLDAGACPEETSTDPVGDGWAVSADTLEELAKVIEVPEDELLKTVKQWNEFVDKGEDLAFYRPSDTLTGLNQPPYYAMLCVPALLNTDGGPVRNEKGEILDPFGQAIPGLYSAGEFGSIWGHLYQGGGNVGECGAFGRISARSALARS
ncbi:MAG: FAD-binding protein, partial [Eggerthella sp.]|nr:FAD-binding protein [Eggerthella sp.]